MPLYSINGQDVDLPPHFENKTPEDQKAYIDDLVANHTDESGKINPPSYASPHEHKYQGAEIGVLTKGLQDIGGSLSHKTIDVLNKVLNKTAPPIPGGTEAPVGTEAWWNSRASVHNAEQIFKTWRDMPPEEQAKWEFSAEEGQLVPKGTAAAKAAEKLAAEEAKKAASKSAISRAVSNVPGAGKLLPYAGRALSGAQLLQGYDRLTKPGWRNKVSGGMNIVGGALPLAGEIFPPLEGIALPASIGLGVGSEFVKPSEDTVTAPTIEVKPTKKKAGGLAHLMRKQYGN